MRFKKRLITKFVLILLLIQFPVFAETERLPLELEIGGSYDNLRRENFSKDFNYWYNLYLDGKYTFGKNKLIYSNFSFGERYNQNDFNLMVGGYYPLAENWTIIAEGSLCPTGKILPIWSILGQIYYNTEFLPGLGALLGVKRASYSNASVNMGMAGLEYYWQSLLLGYTIYLGHLEVEGNPLGLGHLFKVRYYYTDFSFVGLGFSFGQELERDQENILISNVIGGFITGAQWFSENWAVIYDVGLFNYTDGITGNERYARISGKLGVRYKF